VHTVIDRSHWANINFIRKIIDVCSANYGIVNWDCIKIIFGSLIAQIIVIYIICIGEKKIGKKSSYWFTCSFCFFFLLLLRRLFFFFLSSFASLRTFSHKNIRWESPRVWSLFLFALTMLLCMSLSYSFALGTSLIRRLQHTSQERIV